MTSSNRNLHVHRALAGVAATLVVFAATARFGTGLSPDSLSYLSAARAIANGEGLRTPDGGWFTLWPPLFPALIAIPTLFGIDAHFSVRVLNALLFGAIVILSSVLILRMTNRRWLSIVGTISIACSFPILKLVVMTWSEPLFIVLLLSALVQLRSRTLILGLLIASLCMTRYLGIAAIASFVFTIILTSREGWRERGARAIGFAFIAGTPIFAWLCRNKILTGTLTGNRAPPTMTIVGAGTHLFDALAGVLLPPGSGYLLNLGAISALGILIVLSLRWAADNPDRDSITIAAALFIVFYIGLLFVISCSVGLEPISFRYIAVLAPLFILLAIGFIDRLLERLPGMGFEIAGAIVAAGFMLLSINTTAKAIGIWSAVGAGDYSVARWMESPLIGWLQHHPLDGTIYSNAADFLEYRLERRVLPLPAKDADFRAFSAEVESNQRAYGVWFVDSFRGYLVVPSDLVGTVTTTLVAQESDGIIGQLSPCIGSECSGDRVSVELK